MSDGRVLPTRDRLLVARAAREVLGRGAGVRHRTGAGRLRHLGRLLPLDRRTRGPAGRRGRRHRGSSGRGSSRSRPRRRVSLPSGPGASARTPRRPRPLRRRADRSRRQRVRRQLTGRPVDGERSRAFSGAAGRAEVRQAVGVGPEPDAVVEGAVGPGGVGLEAVVSPAQGCEVVVGGGSAPVVGEDVVGVAMSGGSGAPGEHAGRVFELGAGLEAVADLVAVHGEGLGEVDDLGDLDPRRRLAAPGGDLLGEDRAAGPPVGVSTRASSSAPVRASRMVCTTRWMPAGLGELGAGGVEAGEQGGGVRRGRPGSRGRGPGGPRRARGRAAARGGGPRRTGWCRSPRGLSSPPGWWPRRCRRGCSEASWTRT